MVLETRERGGEGTESERETRVAVYIGKRMGCYCSSCRQSDGIAQNQEEKRPEIGIEEEQRQEAMNYVGESSRKDGRMAD